MPSNKKQVAQRREAEHQLSAAEAQRLREVEEHEYQGKATAQAGLNINLVAALTGIFWGKSKKTTDTRPDGSSKSVERRKGNGRWWGTGDATVDAVGSTTTEKTERHRIAREVLDQRERSERRRVAGVDHLGIEDGRSASEEEDSNEETVKIENRKDNAEAEGAKVKNGKVDSGKK